MGIKRVLVGAAVLTATALAAMPGTASAQVENMSVSPQTVEAGHNITISGKCSTMATKANMWYGNADGSGQPYVELDNVAGTKESISGTLMISHGTAPGHYQAVMHCEGDKDQPTTVKFTVAKGGTKAGDGSSLIGGGNTFILIGGGMLVLAAVGGVVYFRRRDSAVSA